MKDETTKYAELIISMSTDFLLGKIGEQHYANTLLMIAQQLFSLTNVSSDKKQ